MVSKFKQYNGADEYRGQSTDVKPVANNGDVFHEIDTGKDFMYNESAGEWKEQPKKGGGGGGGGSVTVDDTLSSTSENPVQNKVIKAALDDKAELVGFPLVANTDLDTLANGTYQLTIEDGVASWTSVAGLSEVDEAERADDNEEGDNA